MEGNGRMVSMKQKAFESDSPLTLRHSVFTHTHTGLSVETRRPQNRRRYHDNITATQESLSIPTNPSISQTYNALKDG